MLIKNVYFLNKFYLLFILETKTLQSYSSVYNLYYLIIDVNLVQRSNIITISYRTQYV